METIVAEDFVVNDMSYMTDMGYAEGMEYAGEMAGGTQQVAKVDELMSSWVFVGGVTVGVLAIGVLLGLWLAKCKIKKGIDLYED